MATTQEQLDQVNSAISAILTRGQAHQILGRSYTAADLRTLFAERTRLEQKLLGETPPGTASRVGLAYLVPE